MPLAWVAVRLLLVVGAAAAGPASVARAGDALADEPRSLAFLGYHHDPHAPALWVETNEPTKAWLVAMAKDHSRLHLEHAVLGRGVWGLPIDTSCFGGPIESIAASPQEEPQTGLVVDIRHRPGTRLSMTVRGNRVRVEANAPHDRPRPGHGHGHRRQRLRRPS